MRAVREGKMQPGIRAADIEAVRVGKDRGVTSGAGDRHGDQVPLPDDRVPDPHLAGRVPVDDGGGGLQPQ